MGQRFEMSQQSAWTLLYNIRFFLRTTASCQSCRGGQRRWTGLDPEEKWNSVRFGCTGEGNIGTPFFPQRFSSDNVHFSTGYSPIRNLILGVWDPSLSRMMVLQLDSSALPIIFFFFSSRSPRILSALSDPHNPQPGTPAMN